MDRRNFLKLAGCMPLATTYLFGDHFGELYKEPWVAISIPFLPRSLTRYMA